MRKVLWILLLTAGVARAEIVQLFNGKDLSNWTATFQDPNVKMQDVFSVTDGVIHCKGKAPVGYIRTKEKYTNFTLKLQWRTMKKGNSGVLLRVQEPDKVWPKSVECQLQTDNSGDIWVIDQYPIHVAEDRTEGRHTKKLHPSNEKPLGEWNQYEITADGTTLTLKVNGLVQNEATEFEEKPGYILLQSEGAEIEFRDIELTTIDQPTEKHDQKKQASLAQSVHELFQLFTPDQKKQLVLPFDSPERTAQVFPPGKRPGIQIKDLSDEQKKKALDLVKSFTSDYGWQKCQAIAKQSHPQRGLEDYYLTFFGEPSETANYAWRVAEHHLTMVDIEFADGKVHAIGPILLGANPPTLWNEEEDSMIKLYRSFSPDEKQKVLREGKSDSGTPIADAGVPVSDLGTDAQKAAQDVLDQRMKFFAPDVAERVKDLLKSAGGIKALKVVFYGEANSRSADAGKWDFKLGTDKFLLDYENTRGHIHMAIKATD
ncbi:MAG TPA: family 16 glycoside hydrolase [Tepidisphaeraceae bacterium]|jgi:hypothetical protein